MKEHITNCLKKMVVRTKELFKPNFLKHMLVRTQTHPKIKLGKRHEEVFPKRESIFGSFQECKQNWLNIQNSQCLHVFHALEDFKDDRPFILG